MLREVWLPRSILRSGPQGIFGGREPGEIGYLLRIEALGSPWKPKGKYAGEVCASE